MVENNLNSNNIAQNGKTISSASTELDIETPSIDRLSFENQFGEYKALDIPEPLTSYSSPDNVYQAPTILSGGRESNNDDSLESFENFLLTKSDTKDGGSIMRTLSEVSSNRYDNFVPGDYNNEDAYGQNQSWGSKMINGVGKGLLLTGTTFLQGTVGLVNGLVQWGNDGRFASFYDNDFNRQLDEIVKKAEDVAPNYYTDVEKNAKFYSPDYFLTGNFLWDGVVKNMGFAAGAYLTGGVYSAGLKGLASLPGASRLLSMGKAAEAVAKSEQMLLTIDKGTEAYGKIKQLSDSYLRTYNVLDKGHRAVVAGLSTSGEAGFEAYQNLNNFRNEKIQEYKDENGGIEPKGSDLEKINREADNIGNSSFLGNVALLSATNYIQFPKILGSSYKAEKGIINNVTKEIGDVTTDATGKFIVKTPKNKVLNTLNKIRPYTFSTSEAFEEGAQFSIGVGVNDYYNKKYNNEATSWLDAVSTGITEGFLSDEGAKNVLIGGLSGAIMMGKSKFQEAKELSKNTAEAVKQFSQYQLSDFTKETKDSVNRGTVLQEEREQLLKEGNITESKDRETDYIINYLTPRIKFGRFDLVKAEIDDYRTLASSDTGFDELVKEGKALPTDTREAFLARLNNFEQTANNVKSLFQSLNLRYSGLINEDKTPMYPSAVIDKMLYATTKISDYEKRIPLLTNQLIGTIDNISEILQDVTEGKMDTFNKAIADLESSKLVNKEELIEALDDAAFMSAKRDVLLKQYDILKKNPGKYKTVEPTIPDKEGNVLDESGKIVPKEIITIKVKDGKTGEVVDKKIEIGTEYLLGRVIKYDKDGNEVIQAPTISILSDNGDGTFKIKDDNGVRNVSSQILEDYQLSKLSDITSDKKKNYVYVNRNNTFSNKLIKDANNKPVIGRLEYTANKDRLIFAYKNEKGQVIRSEVYNNMFKAQGNFKEPIIMQVGKLTSEAAKATQEFVDAPTTISQRLQTRNNIILGLYEKSVKRVDEINKKLNTSKERITKAIEALENQLASESLTKAGKPRKNQTPAMKKIIKELSSLQDTLIKENEQLQSEKEELESNIPFFKDFLDNLDILPESGREMINLLKSDINTLEDLIDITNQAIKDNDNLLKQIEDALIKALSIFNDYIKRLQEDNPGVPLFIDDLRTYLENILKNKGLEELNNISTDFLAKSIELDSDINDFSQELKIPALNKKAEELVKDITDLKEGLDKLISEQIAKQEILSAFEKFAEDTERQKEEAKQMQRNVTLGQELLGTLTGSVQNFFGTKPYEQEAQKDKFAVVGSTKPFTEDTDERPLPGYAARVNHFGARVSDMDNVDDLRGVIVTANTEDQILSGLTDAFMSEDIPGNTPADIKRKEEIRKEVIFLVVTENGQLVDKDGKVIPGKSIEETQEEYNKRLYNNAIFQVFPSASLTSKEKDGKVRSMFRDTVPKYERDSLKEQYKAWRDLQLANTTLDKKGQKFKTSFGNLEFVKYKKQDNTVEVDTSARTSVQDAGLLAKGILNRDAVITVATTNDDKSEGSVSFKAPKGRVFLRVPGQGLVRLFNKKFNKTESEVIFDAMLNLAKNASANGSLYGNEKEEVNKNILNWLKSVVYWGIAKYPDGTRKPAGYNNIWFEDVLVEGKQVKKLFMSGLQKESQKYFDFTPQGLINSKQDILGLLSQMYANTDAKKVNIDNYNASYDEILRFDNLGNPVTRTWPNYQTYLLSANIVDSKGIIIGKRTGKEIPLTTQVRPLTSPEDTNRKGIYFTLNSSVEYTVPAAPVVAPAMVVPAPVVVIPTAQTPTPVLVTTPVVIPQQQPTPPGQFDLNGEVENIRMFGNNVGPIRFTFSSLNAIEYIKSLSTDIFSFQGLLPAEISEAFFQKDIIDINSDDVKLKIGQIKENLRDTNPNATDEELTGKALNIAVSMIWKDVAAQVVAEMTPVQPAIADEASVVEETPVVEEVSDTETKKIDGLAVRNRMQELEKQPVTINITQDSEGKMEQTSEEVVAQIKTELDKIGLPYSDVIANDKGSTYFVVTKDGQQHEILKLIKTGNALVKPTLTKAKWINHLIKTQADDLYNFVNAEIAALEDVAEEVIPEEEVTPTTELPKKNISLRDRTKLNPNINRSEMRVAQVIDQIKQFKPEQWSKVEEAIAKMLPNIPFYRVKNIIKGTNGRQAWGMFHDAAIYVYEGAEEGTAYHEVFEAVWKMFAGPAQKQAIINEFKARKGSFRDRESGKTIEYSKATPYQIKEQLAEEFRDAVLNDKLGVPRESKTLIGRLFSQLMDFIKAFFTGENAQRNTKELFNNIGNGYYAQFNPYQSQLSYAKKGIIDIENAQATGDSEMRSLTIPEIEMHDIIQHMTFLTLTKLSLNNESVFTVNDLNESELYKELQLGILSLLAEKLEITDDQMVAGTVSVQEGTRYINNLETLADNIQNEWAEITANHKAHLKTFDVQFDENDEDILGSEENTGRGELEAANKIDSFRKANAALKLVLSTIPVTQIVNGDISWKPSSIGGVTLIPADQIHIDLKAKLHSSLDIEDMLLGLKTMAENNPNYNALFRRLTGNSAAVGLDINTIQEHDFQLATALWKSISMQNPDVITVFLQEDGDVVVSNSTLSTAAKQAKKEMINNIISTLKEDASIYFRYVPATGKYYAKDNLKALSFDGRELKPYINFLKTIGIDFNERDLIDLKEDQITAFKKAVGDIKNELSKVGDRKIVKDANNNDVEEDGIRAINTKTLNIDGDLLRLAIVKAVVENTEFQSTYFNINGERTQSFIGTNLISALHNTLSKLKNIEELQNDARYKRFAYLSANNDVFVQGSQMLKKMFDIVGPDSTGKRRAGTEDLLKPIIVDGIVDEQTGKKKEASKVTYRQRLIQELNLNISGIFMNLVPGDASLEHAIKMYNEKDPFVKEDQLFNKGYLDIFKDYFMSEVELVKENRNTAKDNGKDLRFFKAILGNDMHNKIASKIKKDTDAEQLYKDNEKEINSAVEAFIKKETEDTETLLKTYDIITEEEGQIKVDKVALFNKEEMVTQAGLNTKLKALTINYMIANIEMHKVLYSDPYQYNDELKRIKNFTSPGQPLVPSSQKIDARLNEIYNKGFKPGDIGYTDMTQDHFKSVTLQDVLSTNENIGYEIPHEETDGGGLIIDKANRVFRLRAGTWTANNEKQFRFDVAFEELFRSGADESTLKKFLKGNPGIKDTYTPIKPIVRGNKDNGRTYNDIVLHKFSLAPLSFRILYELNPNSNAIKLYNKMQKENIDYAVFASGGKVGNEKISPLYNAKGEFDNTPFQDAKELKGNLKDNVKRAVSKIPFTIVAVQSEVPSKDAPFVTQGSQITKLATMDYLQSGVPIDFMPELPTFEDRFDAWLALDDKSTYNNGKNIYNELVNNQKLLEARIEDGIQTLYKKLGIKESINDEGNKEWIIDDREKLIKTLIEEIGKREINYNITDAFEGFVNGDVVLEATPIYQQVRNILYSIADKNIVRPKISGGQKVQVSSALLESVRAEGKPVLDKDGNQEFNKDGSPKFTYESNELKFYKNKDGERVCEIMIGRWFKSNKTDDELMDYFNNDPEGKKEFAAITGVAFRIPTQKQNSIDVFRIKQFLPSDFGDSVIIPSALVKKAGSDFDIDKLSIYLKSLYEDAKGNLKVVPFFGYGQQAKDKFANIYETDIKEKIEKLIKSEGFRENLFDLAEALDNDDILTDSQQTFYDVNSAVINIIKEQSEVNETSFSSYMLNQIVKAGDKEKNLNQKLLNESLKEEYVDSMYKKSLENAYIQSLENLISNPLNYDNLVKPNDATPLKDLSNDVQREMGYEKADFGNVGNMLSRGFMSSLRQSFVGGKAALGIAAQAQTGNAQRQRSVTYIDLDRLEGDLVDEQDKIILGYNADSNIFAKDANINFQEYNSAMVNGKVRPMLSWIKDKAGDYISDITGMFIDGYVDISKGDWIIKLGATTNVASTWLFLVNLGVPIKSVAYFMNQPIIKDYLRAIENKGYSYLYIEDMIADKLADYSPSKEFIKSGTSVKGIPTETDLYKMLKYNNAVPKKDMTDLQKLQQQYMLKEFLKYAKMSSHLFNVSQASNYDTANLNDPYLVFKKMIQLEKARRTIISSVDDIISGSFVRELKDKIFDYRNAFSEILMSDRGNVRQVLQNVLEPYTDMSDRDFVKLSQKAVNDLFDWAVQTKSNVNTKVATVLLGTDSEKSAAEQIINYRDSILGNPVKGISPKPEHKLFNNIILNSLSIDQNDKKGGKKGAPINLVLDNRENKVFDQNLTIYGFNELRETLREEDNLKLYGKLTRLALLQSGLTNSPISFTNLLPYNDFKGLYNETLSILEKLPNLAQFQELDVFQKNNWNNSDVATYKRETIKRLPKKDGTGFYTIKPDTKLVNSLVKAVNNKVIPKLIGLSPMSEAGRSDFVVFTYEDMISPEQRIIRRKNGNTEHQHKVLMKKVYTKDNNNKTIPLTQVTESNGVVYTKYIYKAINAWGDSFRAQEFYTTNQQSVLDNGFDKVNEVEDDVIVGIYNGGATTSPVASIENVSNGVKGSIKMQPDNIDKIKAGTKTITNRTEKEQVEDGIYTLPDGTNVELKLKGKFTVTDRGVELIGATNKDGSYSTWNNIFDSKDDYAKAEGFKDWADFEKNNKFSTNFINGSQNRYVYSIKTVSQQVSNVQVVDRYSIADVKANPNKIYVFGDNLQRTGTGGQAVIRNNPNAMGIVTKLKPTMNPDAFMSDDDIDMNRQNIDSDIRKIKNKNKTLVFPKDGFGTGLAKLKEKAPQTYAYLKQRLLEEFGFNNDTGTVSEKPEVIKLKDGNTYTADQLNTKMLLELNYTLKEAGEIIKNNKC
jgi:hypothetical protein